MHDSPTGQAHFAVASGVFWAAVQDSLSGKAPGRGRLSVHSRVLGAFCGFVKPNFIGDRWRLSGWDDAGPDRVDEDESGWINPTLVIPVERLVVQLSSHLRLLATFQRSFPRTLLESLGADAHLARTFTEGVPLARRLDPPMEPDIDESFPTELTVADASMGTDYLAMVQDAIDRYAAADATTATSLATVTGLTPGDFADRLIFSILASLLSMAEHLAGGETEILIVSAL